MKYIAALVLCICLFCGCSTIKDNSYPVEQRYVILNTASHKIYVPFNSLTGELKDSRVDKDIAAAIRYIKEAKENIEINPTRIASERDLFIAELTDMKMEGLLRSRIPIFFNKETNEWEQKYKLKYVRTPFGGKTLNVINNKGEVILSKPESIGCTRKWEFDIFSNLAFTPKPSITSVFRHLSLVKPECQGID